MKLFELMLRHLRQRIDRFLKSTVSSETVVIRSPSGGYASDESLEPLAFELFDPLDNVAKSLDKCRRLVDFSGETSRLRGRS
jgi:hypothetical protein